MNLQKAILTLSTSQKSSGKDSLLSGIVPTAMLLVTFLYLICLLSLPLGKPDALIWFAVYPIIMSPMSDLSYGSVLKKSFYILPFVMLIGIFNPFIDTAPAFSIGGVIISHGCLTFLSILIRGLLSFQALYILIHLCGFLDFCAALQKIGIPKVMTTQLLMLYRYIDVLMEEAMKLKSSVASRAYGKKSLPIKLWTRIMGNLLLRTVDRSKRIHHAMLARGFDGHIPTETSFHWTSKDSLFLLSWTLIFILLYLLDISKLIIPSFH